MSSLRIWLILAAFVILLAASLFLRPPWSFWRASHLATTVTSSAATTTAGVTNTTSLSQTVPTLAASRPVTTTKQNGGSKRGVATNTYPGGASLNPSPAQPGGMLVQAVTEDADTLNPLLTTNPTSQAVVRQLFPTLLNIDAQTGLITNTALAERWDVSDDGRIYTFHLRSSAQWSDGEPVTAQDVKFTYTALLSPTVQSPFRTILTALEKIEAPDAQTVVVTFAAPDCAALHLLRQPLLPSHRYAADFSDLHSNPLNKAPTVSAGPFQFQAWAPGDQIRLVRNPNDWQGAPLLAEWRYVVVSDPAEQFRQLLGNKIDAMQVPPAMLKSVADDPAVTVYQAPGNSYSFIALNLADPSNPQPGRDATGALQPQTPHPILGDGRVRQAIAYGLDYTRIISDVYQNQGERPATYLPASMSWALDKTLQPYPFQPDKAKQLLTEAGWVDANQDGIRERDGKPLALSLLTNNDSPQRVRIGELVQQLLAALGFDIHFQAVDFAQVSDTLLNQKYDLVVIGWDNVGPDPATSTFWHSRDDTPGAGANFVSFQDQQVDQWLDEAAQLPGCPVAERAQRYRQVERRVYETVPYIFINSEPTAWAFTHHLQGQTPGPWRFENQVQRWWKTP
ncbi:MAG: ABC transporter substrate-binding protein [Caldilineaceae bacterium]